MMQELMRESCGDFKSYLRLEPAMFREMLDRLLPRITKSVHSRPALAPGLRLAITLRFLATGDSYHSLAFTFRVAHNTISILVPHVCSAIVAEYKDEVLVLPSTPDAWREVASGFSRRWNYHNCCGAIDGKHVAIKKPRKSGTAYYNYKGFFSIVLLGLVDADYKFMWVNVGASGSMSDAGVFNESTIEPALREGTLGLPPPDRLPNDNQDTPYFIVGDDAFPLRTYLVKPYSHRYLNHDERIFNYRTSRCRRVVENGGCSVTLRLSYDCPGMQHMVKNVGYLTAIAMSPHGHRTVTLRCYMRRGVEACGIAVSERKFNVKLKKS